MDRKVVQITQNWLWHGCRNRKLVSVNRVDTWQVCPSESCRHPLENHKMHQYDRVDTNIYYVVLSNKLTSPKVKLWLTVERQTNSTALPLKMRSVPFDLDSGLLFAVKTIRSTIPIHPFTFLCSNWRRRAWRARQLRILCRVTSLRQSINQSIINQSINESIYLGVTTQD